MQTVNASKITKNKQKHILNSRLINRKTKNTNMIVDVNKYNFAWALLFILEIRIKRKLNYVFFPVGPYENWRFCIARHLMVWMVKCFSWRIFFSSKENYSKFSTIRFRDKKLFPNKGKEHFLPKWRQTTAFLLLWVSELKWIFFT